MIDAGFALLAERFHPILDVFAECDVKFALEVHPTEIAFDIHTAERALAALDHRPEFGFNFDPSHLIWQGIDPAKFIRKFPDRIFHVHMKDAIGHAGRHQRHPGQPLEFRRPASRLGFPLAGPGRREFRGHHPRLNDIGYSGPLSVEWEDSGMERERGARGGLRVRPPARLRAQPRRLRRGLRKVVPPMKA